MSHKHHHNNNPFKNNSEIFEENNEETKSNDSTEENSSQIHDDKKVNELQEKYDTLNQQYLRLAADFDNYRKRQAQEREDLLKYGAENALKKLIEVLDNFERGEKALADVEDCQQVKTVLILFTNKLLKLLQNSDLKPLKQKERNLTLTSMML